MTTTIYRSTKRLVGAAFTALLLVGAWYGSINDPAVTSEALDVVFLLAAGAVAWLLYELTRSRPPRPRATWPPPVAPPAPPNVIPFPRTPDRAP